MPERILIVGGEADLASSLAAALSGYHAVVADDASTALEYIGAFQPALLLLDMALPQGSGVQLLEALASGKYPVAPALLLVGAGDAVDLAPYANVVVGVMAKPVLPEDVRHRVEGALAVARRKTPGVGRAPSGTGEALVVEDDPDLRQGVVACLKQVGYRVEAAGSAPAAISLLGTRRFDVVLTDYILPGTSGLAVLQEARSAAPEAPAVLLTGYATPELIRRALSLGAADVLVKPFALQTLPLVLQKCRQMAQMATGAPEPMAAHPDARTHRPGRERTRRSVEPPPQRYTLAHIIGESPAITEAVQKAQLVAPLDSTVLILGETGTGKEMFAQSLHAASRRANGPMVSVNVAAIPESLVESELFGYAPGAFTGARREGYAGRLAEANGGTFFLDEIGELPMHLQVKLLRVLEEGEVMPVGGGSRRIDVRFVAATHRNLPEMVRQGTFRSDLYYRLNVVLIHLPPLRERREDIPALAQHFLAQLRSRYGSDDRHFATETLEVMQHYPWPGNVRELHNAVEHAYALAAGPVILPSHLPAWVQRMEQPEEAEPPRPPAADARTAEREAIISALQETRGNKSKAARLLGISRAGLYIKLKVHHLL